MVLVCKVQTGGTGLLVQVNHTAVAVVAAAVGIRIVDLDRGMAAGRAETHPALEVHSLAVVVDIEVGIEIAHRSKWELVALRHSLVVVLGSRSPAAVDSLDPGGCRTMVRESRSHLSVLANRIGCGRIGCMGQT